MLRKQKEKRVRIGPRIRCQKRENSEQNTKKNEKEVNVVPNHEPQASLLHSTTLVYQ